MGDAPAKLALYAWNPTRGSAVDEFSVSSSRSVIALVRAAGFLQLRQHLVEREAAGLLPRRELDIGLQVLADEVLCRHEREGPFDTPPVAVAGFGLSDLEGIGPQVHELRKAQRPQRVLPHGEAGGALLQEQKLPALIAQGGKIAVVGPVEELLALARSVAGQQIALVVAVEMDLEIFVRRLVTRQELLRHIRLAGRGHQCRHPIFMRDDLVDLRARLDDAGPADYAGNAIAAFPARVLLAAERRCPAVGP